jgi:hypothetical protein
VQVGLDDDFALALGCTHRARRGREQVADAVDVEHEPVGRAPGKVASET